MTATHLPTGTSYSAASTDTGRYNFGGLIVGGPYKLTTRRLGKKTNSFVNPRSISSTSASARSGQSTRPPKSSCSSTLGSATYNSTGQVRPTCTTEPANATIDNIASRWRIQFGATVRF